MRIGLYLQEIPGVPPLTKSINPATWVLQATASSIERELGIDFAEVYAASTQHRWGSTHLWPKLCLGYSAQPNTQSLKLGHKCLYRPAQSTTCHVALQGWLELMHKAERTRSWPSSASF